MCVCVGVCGKRIVTESDLYIRIDLEAVMRNRPSIQGQNLWASKEDVSDALSSVQFTALKCGHDTCIRRSCAVRH